MIFFKGKGLKRKPRSMQLPISYLSYAMLLHHLKITIFQIIFIKFLKHYLTLDYNSYKYNLSCQVEHVELYNQFLVSLIQLHSSRLVIIVATGWSQ